MIQLKVQDETSQLKAVILGIAESFGGTPSLSEAFDPKSKEHIRNGTFPVERDLKKEMEAVVAVFAKHGVRVYRPKVIADTNQIFARDIGFVIDDKFIIPNIILDRAYEQIGIQYVLDQIDLSQQIKMPEGVFAEGGDVMLWKGKIYVGYSEETDFEKYKVSRTNRAGVEFLKKQFPHYEVYSFQLHKSDEQARDNALHLDCCFQPIGDNECIVYKGGFKIEAEYDLLISHFGKENCIEITKDEMYNMNSNIFSISPKVIVSEKKFERLNTELEKRGFQVEKVPYSETAKMEGLLRCSTLPLQREH